MPKEGHRNSGREEFEKSLGERGKDLPLVGHWRECGTNLSLEGNFANTLQICLSVDPENPLTRNLFYEIMKDVNVELSTSTFIHCC